MPLTKVLLTVLPLALQSAFHPITFPTIPCQIQADTSSRVHTNKNVERLGQRSSGKREPTSGGWLGKMVPVVVLVQAGQRRLGGALIGRLARQLHGPHNCQRPTDFIFSALAKQTSPLCQDQGDWNTDFIQTGLPFLVVLARFLKQFCILYIFYLFIFMKGQKSPLLGSCFKIVFTALLDKRLLLSKRVTQMSIILIFVYRHVPHTEKKIPRLSISQNLVFFGPVLKCSAGLSSLRHPGCFPQPQQPRRSAGVSAGFPAPHCGVLHQV